MRKGYTLAESVIGMLLLLATFAVMARLYDAAIERASASEQRYLATLVAQRELERVRTWSASQHGDGGLPFSDWSAVEGSGPATDFPEFTVEVRTSAVTLLSPSTAFESVFPVAQQKQLNASARRVEVEVSFQGGNTRLVSVLTEPPRSNPQVVVTITTGSSPLARDATLELEAAASAGGQPLDDLQFGWHIEGAGNGTLELLQRDGSQARFTNRIEIPGQGTVYSADSTPGATCQIAARIIYQGREIVGRSAVVVLQ